jgi:hypothetical protein
MVCTSRVITSLIFMVALLSRGIRGKTNSGDRCCVA